MPLYAPQRRDRKPFVSSKSRRLLKSQAKLLTDHLATLDNPDLSEALKAALKAFGFRQKKAKIVPAALSPEVLTEGKGPLDGAVGQPTSYEKPAAIKPEKSRITATMQGIIDSRPDLAEALTEIANQSTPPPVRIPLMRKLIKDNPPA